MGKGRTTWREAAGTMLPSSGSVAFYPCLAGYLSAMPKTKLLMAVIPLATLFES